MTALVVTGGRRYKVSALDRLLLDELVRRYSEVDPITTVVHGACEGADEGCDAWARSRGIAVDPHPVYHSDWDRHGAAAGPMRNEKMVATARREHESVVGVAFPGDRGTKDCVAAMGRHKVPLEDLRGRRGCQRWGRVEADEWRRHSCTREAALAIWQSHDALADFGPAIISAHYLPTPWPEVGVHDLGTPNDEDPDDAAKRCAEADEILIKAGFYLIEREDD